jgi:AraC-like DNA-binding protein
LFTGSEPENKGRLYWIELKVVSPSQSVLGLPIKESQLLIRRLGRLPFRHLRHGEILFPTLERIFRVFADTQNQFRTTELRNLLVRFFLDVVALAEHKGEPLPIVGIKRALNYIEDHPSMSVPLAELARQAHLSDSYFKRVFKQHTGMPPIEYVIQRRIELAKQRLRGTDTPITRVAMDLGFATSQHFATVFKRITGKTPREFSRNTTRRAKRESPQAGAGVGFHPVGDSPRP